MKAKIIKLNYDGTIDLRDYNVRRCILRNEKYEVTCGGDVMIFSPEDLKNNCLRKQEVPSKFGKPYELWSYKFNPIEL